MKLIVILLIFVAFTHIERAESGPVPLTYLEPWNYNYRPFPPSFARQIEYDDDEEDADDEDNEEEEDDDADDDDTQDAVYPEPSSKVFPKFDGTEKDPTTINEYQNHFPTSFTKRAGRPNKAKANKKSKPSKPQPPPSRPPPSSASDESVEDYGNVPWMRERKISSSVMDDFHGPVMKRPPGGGFYPQRRRISSANFMNARSSVAGGGLFSRRVIPGIIPDQGIKVYYYNNGYGRGRGFY